MLEKLLFELGGPVLAKVIGMKFGKEGSELAQLALDALGDAFGYEPKGGGPMTRAVAEELLVTARNGNRAEAEARVTAAQANLASELLAQAEVWKASNESQRMTNELLQGQLKTPGWRSDWLFVWQWFLMAAWAWTLIVVHILNAAIRLMSGVGAADAGNLPAPDPAILVTLTGLYLGLHMGGHTVLELMRGGTFKRVPKGDAGLEQE